MHKTDIFPVIAEGRDPQSILSVGDQLETDIAPAALLGFQTFHVISPKDLLKLLDNE